MTRAAFKHLSPGTDGPIDGSDPIMRLWMRALRQAGVDGDRANVILNATLDRIQSQVAETGKKVRLADATVIFYNQAETEGLSFEKAEKVAESVLTAIMEKPLSTNEELLSRENITAVETFLMTELNEGRISLEDWADIVANSDDVEGVEFATALMNYRQSNGPAPTHPDLPNLDVSKFAPGNSGQNRQDTTHDDQQQEHDNMSSNDTKENSPEQKKAKIAAYARYQTPLQNAPGPEGDLFRQETEKAFEEAFGTEPAGETGSSEPGYGV